MRVLATGLAFLLLSFTPALAGGNYQCRNQDGTIAEVPPSKSAAKALEDRNARIDCFRNGKAITSSRDEYLERRNQERRNEQRGNSSHDRYGSSERLNRKNEDQYRYDRPAHDRNRDRRYDKPTFNDDDGYGESRREIDRDGAYRACASRFGGGRRLIETRKVENGQWIIILSDGAYGQARCKVDKTGRIVETDRR